MFRAVETFRWGAASAVAGGLVVVGFGVTGGEPQVDRFTAILGAAGVAGLAGVARWVLRLIARATPVVAQEESSRRRRWWRAVVICASPVILVQGAALYPTRHTWLVGLIWAVSGALQLAFAVWIARIERRSGARMLVDNRRYYLAH
jgi:undecaprenyl pyrophosphate phosphatase UppP